MNQNLIPWSECYQTVTPVGEIFVVDDDEDIREIVAITLARQGFPVKTFEDGEAFLRVAGERVVHGVIARRSFSRLPETTFQRSWKR